ncbi:MAG: HAMP domain-containing histidine kinase [Oscillospiraceae bacterium]|nr:HAMP domain-containing histidine kinase [Oscillospiraceae bacterium]
MQIKRVAADIVNNVDSADLVAIVNSISESNDITADITEHNGASRLRQTPLQDRRVMEAYAALISLARDNGNEFYEYSTMSPTPPRYGSFRDNRIPMQSLIYVKLADDAMGEPFAVIINATISPVNATVATLRYQLYFISGIMLLLAVFLAIIIAKRVSRPIEAINKGAFSLSKGNYATRFTGKGFKEIVELSETLNTAAIELGKVENLRRELLANVSHDLRTPLSLIYSYAELMHDFPDETTSEQTQVIMDETSRLAALVSDVLDISKLEADMEQLNTSRFNLTANLSDTADLVEELLQREGYTIRYEKNGYDEIYVDADEMKINRAFYNLLMNAINYSGDSKNITVTQTVNDNHVKISVTDYGEGISAEDLSSIWDRYYKSSKEHKRAPAGTGLGLSIVKKIIELHGGRYGVISNIDKGSTFWFELCCDVTIHAR